MNTAKKYGKKTALALNTWVKLARAFSTFSKLSNENIKSFGLTPPQFAVIECLGHLGEMSIGTLSAKMLVTGGNMTLVVDNLERQGLVERIHSSEDRRAIKVRLTKKGQALFGSIFSKHAEFITKISSVLTEKELMELGRLLKKLGLSLKY
ncbi:MAG: MarR family transcriptional regulator [Ignavibacteria bacterium]|nr:MarR family transcriptional regulator [Ignavibacteria bacterium]